MYSLVCSYRCRCLDGGDEACCHFLIVPLQIVGEVSDVQSGVQLQVSLSGWW